MEDLFMICIMLEWATPIISLIGEDLLPGKLVFFFKWRDFHPIRWIRQIEQNHSWMNRIHLQPHTSTENILAYCLEWLTAKHVIWVQSLIKSLNFFEFVYSDENYEKTQILSYCALSTYIEKIASVLEKETITNSAYADFCRSFLRVIPSCCSRRNKLFRVQVQQCVPAVPFISTSTIQ